MSRKIIAYAVNENQSKEIWKFAATVQYKNLFEDTSTTEFGVWLRTRLVSLGPAFVKMGQFLSTRTDLLGKDVTDELAKLQDQVTEVPIEGIRQVIEEDLEKPFDEVFSSFQTHSIGSASIGQVHRAVLRNGGWDVIVKVQKPNVDRQINADIQTLETVFRTLLFWNKQRQQECLELLTQYKTFLTAELDYRIEMTNMQLMKTQLADFEGVKIPRVYSKLSRRRVLFMEYVPSIKISELDKIREAGIPTEALATTIVNAFLHATVKYGTLYCDPHPGNLGVQTDGTIVIYDFGNVVQLDPMFIENVPKLLFAIYQKDIDEFMTLIIDLKIVIPTETTDLLELRAFFTYFFDYLENLDLSELRTSIIADELSESGVQVKLDQNILYLFRVFALLDGTCVRLNPKFNYVKAMGPIVNDIFGNSSFLQSRVQKEISKLSLYPKMLQTTDQNVTRVTKRIKNLSSETRYFYGITLALSTANLIENPKYVLLLLPIMLAIVKLKEPKSK